jgi:hypothetical protein
LEFTSLEGLQPNMNKAERIMAATAPLPLMDIGFILLLPPNLFNVLCTPPLNTRINPPGNNRIVR